MPDDLYARAKERAKNEGVSLSEFVIGVLGRELERPVLTQWVSRARQAAAETPQTRVDIETLMDDVRSERDA